MQAEGFRAPGVSISGLSLSNVGLGFRVGV